MFRLRSFVLAPCGLNKKTASRLAVFVKAVLFVSAPPDRLRRGIKVAEKEHGGTNHALQSTKTGRITPSAQRTAGTITATLLSTSKRRSVAISAKPTNHQQRSTRTRFSVCYIVWVRYVEKGMDIMQTGHGKRAAFLTVSLMLSACGGGGGGTVATPTGTKLPTTPLTNWTDSVQPNAKVEATGRGKQTTYTYDGSKVTSIPDVPVPGDVTASAIFEFDESAALTLVTLNSNGSLSVVGPASDLADPDFVMAKGSSSKAVVSSPESGAWDYQSFGVWENGLGAGVTTRSAGAMSVGVLTPADQVRLVEGATFTGKIVGSYINNPQGLGHTVVSGLTVVLSGQSLIFSTSNPLVSPDPFNGVPFAPPSDYGITTDLNLKGSINYVAGTNTFSGTLSTVNGELSGDSTGQFYGPNAVELGGVFFLPAAGDSVETYSGAYGAVRPAP